MNTIKAYAIQYPNGEIAPLAFPSPDALIGYITLAGGRGSEPDHVKEALARDNLRIVEVKLFTLS